MDVFFTGLLTLLAVTAIVYIVLFSFIYYWHLKKVSFIIVPVIFTFEFFVKGFIAVAVVSIFFYFMPFLINLLGT